MNTHRFHAKPLAAAIAATLCFGLSAGLTARAATYARTATPAHAITQSTSQSNQTTDKAAKQNKKSSQKANKNGNVTTLSVVNVVGVRASQMRAIQLKRTAPNIQDSITSERIGQLPDVTITDALQRVTGVQINRVAGVGTSIDVRGLPQVGTLLNGEVFITPDQIDSQQPNFQDLPATLIRRVDVIKSPTASMLNTGISGTLDLHTYRPWDLPSGFTFSGAAKGEYGDKVKSFKPQFSGLASYNDNGRWGILLDAAYSDSIRNNAWEGLDQYGVVMDGENAASAGGYSGFLTSWDGKPFPSAYHLLPGGNVDVNGDGKANGVFMGSQNIALYDTQTERRNTSFGSSFQADLGSGFTLTSDFMYMREDQWDRNHGIQFNSLGWQGATFVPLKAANTGKQIAGQYGTPQPGWSNMDLYTTQVYKKWPGDTESFSQITQTNSQARNFNVDLKFNNGGPFTGDLRGVRDTASQRQVETDINIANADGTQWPNDPANAAPPGTYIYPSQLGGNRVFNPNGVPFNTVPIVADFTGRRLGVTMPASLASKFANADGWAMKTWESGDDYRRNVSMNILRFDGHWDFDNGIVLDFGVRNSIRGAQNDAFTLGARVYAGMGATDPNGCLARYLGADVVLNAANSGPCTAGNSQGFFRAGVISAQPMSKTPKPLSNNFRKYTDLMGSGITFWALDPKALDNPISVWKKVYPHTVEIPEPGISWGVRLHTKSAYLQADFDGYWGNMPYAINVGERIVKTDLSVTTHLTGVPAILGVETPNGVSLSQRSYNDYLPAFNFSLGLTQKLKFRLAFSKNMMPLDLSQWGGGLTLGYSLTTLPSGQTYFRVANGNSSGNPKLKPWRSRNYGASLEYYINSSTMLSLAYFKIKVQSFIKSGNVTACGLPDADGVVRNHCISISEPIQGSGNSIHGFEFDYRQAFTRLPGLLSHTGVEINGTYAPSSSGETDLAGNKIPFQDNSKKSGNVVLWYQGGKFQARVGYNYRSRRAVTDDVGGIAGLEEYEAPQKYLDASLSYQVTKNLQVFVQGSNLTDEYQRFYLVWPSQEAHANFFERSYMIGVRGQF